MPWPLGQDTGCQCPLWLSVVHRERLQLFAFRLLKLCSIIRREQPFVDGTVHHLLVLFSHLDPCILAQALGRQAGKHTHFTASFARDLKDGAAGPLKVQEALLSTKVIDDPKFSISSFRNSSAVCIQKIRWDRHISDLLDHEEAAARPYMVSDDTASFDFPIAHGVIGQAKEPSSPAFQPSGI